MDILGPDRGKMTIYGSDFRQVNLTPNGGVSPTVQTLYSLVCVKPGRKQDCWFSHDALIYSFNIPILMHFYFLHIENTVF